MNMYGYEIVRESDLAHYGLKGMKWGTRRWQNEDGSFNSAGKQRYFGSGGGENYKPVGGGGGSRSAKGNAHRALAKVYDINERFYSKHGNKTMASANKAAKAQQLKKADTADQHKQKKQEDRLNKNFEKIDARVNKSFQDTEAGRAKTREKLYKKGASDEKIKDFDRGTKYVRAGQNRVRSVVDTYKSMQLSAVQDRSIKKTKEYKRAISQFKSVSRNTPLATLGYAMKEAGKDQERKKK